MILSVVSIGSSGVLLLELSLTVTAAALNLEEWRDRIRSLLRVEVSAPARAGVVVLGSATIGLIALGFTRGRLHVVSGAMCAGVAAGVVAAQWRAGDRGTALAPYAFFCSCGAALAASAA